MSVEPGTQLGPYELVRVIGAGGMGEVYLAKDQRLGREVAIKILLPGFASDQERLKRFEQEARAIALLNHPNVMQVYDTGLHEGTPYLVMELLEGQTLRERMNGGALSPRKAGEIALQIVRGLAAAHDKGITHRDLKPENIFLTGDTHLKILDFGLAKLRNPLPSDSTTTQDGPTLPMETRLGVMVGTVGYMSPEQVNGRPADPRSDIFAFGVILWEMLLGQRPFQGESAVEVMHAILKLDPPEKESLQLPENLSWLLRRCLQKDPKARFQSALDLGFELERALEHLSSGSVLRPLPTFPRLRRNALRWAGWAVGVLALAGAGWGSARLLAPPPTPSLYRLTYQGGVIKSARWVPGGQNFVFGLARPTQPVELFVGGVEGVGVRPLGLPHGTELLAVSAQGELAVLLPGATALMGTFAQMGTLARVPLSGGAPREVLEQVLEADWDPQGRELAVLRKVANGCLRVEYPIGNPCYEAAEGLLVEGLKVSPKGDQVAFTTHPAAGQANLMLVNRKGKVRTLFQGDLYTFQWAPDASEILYTLRLPGDRQELRAVGTASGRNRTVQSVMGRIQLHDMSRGGQLLLRHTISRMGMMATRPGTEGEQDLSWLQSSDPADISVDGRKLLFGEMREGRGPGGAYLRSLDGADAIRLGDGDPLALSRDGRWAVVRTVEGPPELVLLPTGPGESRRLPTHGVKAEWVAFLRDGRNILLGGVAQGSTVFRYYLQNLETGNLRVWKEQGNSEATCLVSPDGMTIAMGPEDDGEVHLYPLAGGPGRRLGPLEAHESLLQWSADGGALYVAKVKQLQGEVLRWDLATGRRTSWRIISPPEGLGVTALKTLVMHPEGKTWAYSVRRTLTSDLYLMEGWR